MKIVNISGNSTINIGLLGLGTVGTGTMQIINANRADIAAKTGSELRITKALVRDLHKQRPHLDPAVELTLDPDPILTDPDIDIVVDVMGGLEPAGQYITTALEQGKHVVTANKDLMALHGRRLFAVAQQHNRNIYYEASVGGGIPLIRPIKHCLVANKIKSIMGIINGTTNYILTQMTIAKKDLQDALAEAQAKGFAEQDPSNDLEGRDAAYKLAILAGLAFQSIVKVEDISIESISDVSVRDIMYAEELGFVIKLLAIGEENRDGLKLRVHPTLVPKEHPLASVHNEFNALFLVGDSVGELMFYGRGAGSLPTASAVVADIIEAVRNINHEIENHAIETNYAAKPVVPLSQSQSRFYVRLKAKDQPGVFGSVATVFGDAHVSLDMILQTRREVNLAEIVLVTHEVVEHDFYQALERIKKIDSIRNISNVIRVLERS